jgi:hypothetical protein
MTRDDLYPRDENLRNTLQDDCTACSLHTGRHRISWGHGRVPCKLMLVGEAPARGEPLAPLWKGSNYTGIPYTNKRSGVKLRELMCKLGAELNRHVYVTNVVKCYPGCCVAESRNGRRRNWRTSTSTPVGCICRGNCRWSSQSLSFASAATPGISSTVRLGGPPRSCPLA